MKRGFVPEDKTQFTGEQLENLKKAAAEVQYLLDRGYGIKPVTTFIGNHYLFSERQRLSLARSVSSNEDIKRREKKQILEHKKGLTVYVDGFNVIITLETALSGSPVFLCRDRTIRDLAGLRGTYRIIDRTEQAIYLIFCQFQKWEIKEAVFYLDSPVSNSGRLGSLLLEKAKEFDFPVSTQVIPDVDRTLQEKSGVITSDAIILNHCESWINLLPPILEELPDIWMISL